MRKTFRIYTQAISYHDENGWHDTTNGHLAYFAHPDMCCYSYIDIDEDGIVCNSGTEDFSIERSRTSLNLNWYEVAVRYPETREDLSRKSYSELVFSKSFHISKKDTGRTALRSWKHYVRDNLLPKHYYEDIMNGIGELEFRSI